MEDQKGSEWWFRSTDPRVMGPMRFLCANSLINFCKLNLYKCRIQLFKKRKRTVVTRASHVVTHRTTGLA